jgi:hypothetical protein
VGHEKPPAQGGRTFNFLIFGGFSAFRIEKPEFFSKFFLTGKISCDMLDLTLN